MPELQAFLDNIDGYIWGLPMLVLLMGTGVLLTVRLNLIQVFRLPMALKLIFTARNEGIGDVSSFKSLCTALAATVGTGNIVGVATAVMSGGPGALFWMWVAAFLGIATKYAEGLLSIRFRTFDERGEALGGPMRYIEMGLGAKWKFLAILFAIFGALAGVLGIGTSTQVNAVINAFNSSFGFNMFYTALVVAALVALVILGGIRSIATVSASIVPIMCLVYVFFGLGILVEHWAQVPAAFALIFREAFNFNAIGGGITGSVFAAAIRTGVARGIFSNEAGLGSAPIASAAAKTHWAAEQGLISMTGTFIDTIIICSVTGLSLIVTNVYTGTERGARLTQAAFGEVYGEIGPYILTVCLALFAFTTILGWAYYGERCATYVFGVKATLPYRLLYILAVALAAYEFPLDVVWAVADITNGLMAFPNLIALVGLSSVVVVETRKYFQHLSSIRR
ncbi:MAG: sodium:alanine symporter family protein [Planctomycetota bacterium]|jgi:AGCS family alanine or glycine:cation symporter|nr:sodium:alanine symporter family protein [Planctomycetota bacterium]